MAPPRRPAAAVTRSPGGLLDATERALRAERIDLVAVTGASNVTGEVWPVAELASSRTRTGQAVRRRRPARAAPADRHAARRDRPAGVLRPQAVRAVRRRHAGRAVGPASRCCTAAARSGSSRSTTSIWADAPDRYEAGSPNVIGVVALAAACRSLLASGWTRSPSTSGGSPPPVVGPDDGPGSRAAVPVAGRDRRPRRRRDLQPRRLPRAVLAAILSAEHAIGVRHGCFCAHPLMTRLLGCRRPSRAGCTPSSAPAETRAAGRGAREHRPRHDGRRHRPARRRPARDRRPRPADRNEHVPDHDEYRPLAKAAAA